MHANASYSLKACSRLDKSTRLSASAPNAPYYGPWPYTQINAQILSRPYVSPCSVRVSHPPSRLLWQGDGDLLPFGRQSHLHLMLFYSGLQRDYFLSV